MPNSMILGSEGLNYSSISQESGLILHTTVRIGYETPWWQVEAMLLEAAARTPGLRREPAQPKDEWYTAPLALRNLHSWRSANPSR